MIRRTDAATGGSSLFVAVALHTPSHSICKRFVLTAFSTPRRIGNSVRRISSIILILCFAARGSGVLEHWHNEDHAREDATMAAEAQAAGLPAPARPHHDETNCFLHALLHLPLMLAGWVPLLVCLGLFVAFLTLLSHPLVSLRIPTRLDCRGPPLAA